MGSISRRTSRRGVNKEKKRSSYKDYDNNRHTTNIIATNAAVIYSNDKAQHLVKEILSQKQVSPGPKNVMEAK